MSQIALVKRWFLMIPPQTSKILPWCQTFARISPTPTTPLHPSNWLARGYAFAQSVKLATFEKIVDAAIEKALDVRRGFGPRSSKQNHTGSCIHRVLFFSFCFFFFFSRGEPLNTMSLIIEILFYTRIQDVFLNQLDCFSSESHRERQRCSTAPLAK